MPNIQTHKKERNDGKTARGYERSSKVARDGGNKLMAERSWDTGQIEQMLSWEEVISNCISLLTIKEVPPQTELFLL